MCLAIPGKIERISGDDPLTRMGHVNFGGILKEACLAYVPEATVGDYVIVHVGFALSRVDEAEAHADDENNRQTEHHRQIGTVAIVTEWHAKTADTFNNDQFSLRLGSAAG